MGLPSASRRARSRPRSLAAALTLLLAAALAAPALADPPPSVSEYVETVPSAAGGKVPGAAKGKARPLAPRIRHRLRREAGSDAALLEQIATDPAYGAPAKAPVTKLTSGNEAATPPKNTPASPNAKTPSATANANAPNRTTRAVQAASSGVVGGPSSDMLRLEVLGGVLLAGVAAAAVFAYRRRRGARLGRTPGVS